ncbi:MAG: GNAT family N-acetyltransferase [Alphaproteobacteria bacterium]
MTERRDVAEVEALAGSDLEELCEAAEDAIGDGGGFGWITPPRRHVMEAYWRGVLLVPQRSLFIARFEGTIAGSAQLVRPTANAEARAFAVDLTTHFIAPRRAGGWAGALSRQSSSGAGRSATRVINLDVRETLQDGAIVLYDQMGYQRWGTHPRYARVGGRYIAGHYYMKEIAPAAGETKAP